MDNQLTHAARLHDPGAMLLNRRRGLLLTCLAMIGHSIPKRGHAALPPGILSEAEGWRRINLALYNADVGMYAAFDEHDLRCILRNQAIRATEGVGQGPHGAREAAREAADRHRSQFPGPYYGWITLVGLSRRGLTFTRVTAASSEAYYGMLPQAHDGRILCGLGMYLDDSLADAVQVTVISVQGPVVHRLVGPLFSEPWRW